MTASPTLAEFRKSGTTLANREIDFPEWHRGRPHYYCWVVLVDDPGWIDDARRAAGSLTPWLVPDYERQAHVTILPGGFPEAPISRKALTAATRQVAPFSIKLGPLGSFISSPCFDIHDASGGLLALRQALRPVLFDPGSQVEDDDYRPHLTVGLYRDRFETGEIAARIDAFRKAETRTFPVREIALCAYSTRSIKGALLTVARMVIGEGILSVDDHHALFP